MAISKIILNGITQIDLTQDTVSQASHILSPYIGHLNDGTQVTGTGEGGGSVTWDTLYEGSATIVSSSPNYILIDNFTDVIGEGETLEGGGNDAGNAITVGTLTSGYTETLNTNTFAGAFEDMLKSAITRFPNKKLGYVMIHKCFPGFTSLSGDDAYYNIAKSACEKWGIPFLDLSILVPPLADVSALAQAYTQDGYGVHPNEAGYRLFYIPKITAFLKGL